MFESTSKVVTAAKPGGKGSRKKKSGTFSCKFVYCLVPILSPGDTTKEFKIGKRDAEFDNLIADCKAFNMRFGTYYTNFYVEFFRVEHEATGAQIERLILNLRDLPVPDPDANGEFYYPFKPKTRGISDIGNAELKAILERRMKKRPSPLDNNLSYADLIFENTNPESEQLIGFTMVLNFVHYFIAYHLKYS